MARLMADAQMGFYPINPVVTDLILHHLSLSSDKKKADAACIIDPCCGKGVALAQLREGLGVKPERTYAIELDGGRGAEAKLNLAGSHVLSPCSFFTTSVTSYSMGMVYLNPPFSDELGGGGREETRFLDKCNRLLVPGGILVMVFPVHIIQSSGTSAGRLRRMLDCYYEDMRLYTFPAEHRKFQEVVLFGVRRKAELIDISYGDSFFTRISITNTYRQEDPVVGSDNKVYHIPESWAPNQFIKAGYLDHELLEDIEKSPLSCHLEPPKVLERRRPLLPLSKGHKALLLASGLLDGIVEPEGEAPHIVRGSTSKVDYVSEQSSKMDSETGVTTVKTVVSQRPVLTIRAVTEDGTILTLSDEVNTEGDEEAEVVEE